MAVDSIYRPLPGKAQTIRLLRLLPNTFNRDVECELLERPIAEARNQYIAISYTWGNIGATKQVLITCNGVRVPVSENLFTVLRRLRHPLRNANVWVDALCINQADVSERTHQVGLMGDIYRNSRETVIWLGEPTAKDEDGKRFSRSCCSTANKLYQAQGGPLRLVWHGGAADEYTMNQYLDDCLHDDLSSADVPNDVFGAFCLISSLAQGTSSRLLEMLKYDESKLWSRYDQGQGLYDLLSGDVHLLGSRASRVFAGLERIMSRPWVSSCKTDDFHYTRHCRRRANSKTCATDVSTSVRVSPAPISNIGVYMSDTFTNNDPVDSYLGNSRNCPFPKSDGTLWTALCALDNVLRGRNSLCPRSTNPLSRPFGYLPRSTYVDHV